MTKQSIKVATKPLEKESSANEPADASLRAIVRERRASIMAKRAEGASWAQIAAVIRAVNASSVVCEDGLRKSRKIRPPISADSNHRKRR